MVEGDVPLEILLPIAEQDAFSKYLTGCSTLEDVLSKIGGIQAELPG